MLPFRKRTTDGHRIVAVTGCALLGAALVLAIHGSLTDSHAELARAGMPFGSAFVGLWILEAFFADTRDKSNPNDYARACGLSLSVGCLLFGLGCLLTGAAISPLGIASFIVLGLAVVGLLLLALRRALA